MVPHPMLVTVGYHTTSKIFNTNSTHDHTRCADHSNTTIITAPCRTGVHLHRRYAIKYRRRIAGFGAALLPHASPNQPVGSTQTIKAKATTAAPGRQIPRSQLTRLQHVRLAAPANCAAAPWQRRANEWLCVALHHQAPPVSFPLSKFKVPHIRSAALKFAECSVRGSFRFFEFSLAAY